MDLGPQEMTDEQRAEMREARRIRIERRWRWARIISSVAGGAIFSSSYTNPPVWLHIVTTFAGCCFGIVTVEFVRTTYPRRRP